MSKLTIISILLLLGCMTKDSYDLFKIESSKNSEILDVEKINDIKTFNSKFWQQDSIDDEFYFIAKFDFKKGDFSLNSDQGIRIEGLPFLCLEESDCLQNYGQRFYITDNYEILDEELEFVSEEKLKELLKANILNYGKDPILSDEPKEAATILYLKPKHRLNRLGPIIKIFADGYRELIESKRIETKLATEKLAIEFPFKIDLRTSITSKYPPKSMELPNDELIERELFLDSAIQDED